MLWQHKAGCHHPDLSSRLWASTQSRKGSRFFRGHHPKHHSQNANFSALNACNNVIGIDLGTTNSAVAVLQDGQPVVLSDPLTGSFTVPSTAAVFQDGKVTVGAAAETADVASAVIFSSMKRLIGRTYNEAYAQVGAKLPYHFQCGPAGEPQLVTPWGSPVDIIPLTAELLRYLINMAQQQVGSSEPPASAVIGVPAHFSSAQKMATLQAARDAGLTSVQLLQEPVAAALAYGVVNAQQHATILVFDLGGGTFDCSLLSAFERIVEVLETDGDAWLGGDDWDAALLTHVERMWPRQVAAWRGVATSNQACEPLMAAIKAAKIRLSSSVSTQLVLHGQRSTPLDSIAITREEFEHVTSELLQRTLAPLHNMGKAAFIKWQNSPIALLSSSTCGVAQPSTPAPVAYAPPPRVISEVVMVGGATHMPAVRSLIEQLTGVEPCSTVDPEQAVALGCAIQAGLLTGQLNGLEVMDGGYLDEMHDRVTGFVGWTP